MPTYRIYPKGADTDEPCLYEFTHATLIEFSNYPFAAYDYREYASGEPRPTRYGGRRDLTHEEFSDLFTEEERWDIDEFEDVYQTLALPADVIKRIRSGFKSFHRATAVNLDDPKVAMVLGTFTGLQLIAIGRMEEILNG